jgi:hypothetical protein
MIIFLPILGGGRAQGAPPTPPPPPHGSAHATVPFWKTTVYVQVQHVQPTSEQYVNNWSYILHSTSCKWGLGEGENG